MAVSILFLCAALSWEPTTEMFSATMARVAWYAVLYQWHDGPASRLKLGYFATEGEADVVINAMWPFLHAMGYIDWVAVRTLAFAPRCMRFLQ